MKPRTNADETKSKQLEINETYFCISWREMQKLKKYKHGLIEHNTKKHQVLLLYIQYITSKIHLPIRKWAVLCTGLGLLFRW